MSLPMMPFWVPDYIADTTHLTLAEHGAYLLLICHYWQNGGLPTDETRLARIIGADDKQWSSIAPALKELFEENWSHGRIDRELAIAKEKHEKRVNAGKLGAKVKQSGKQCSSIAPALRKQPEPEPLKDGADAPSDEKQLFDRGVQVLGPKGRGLIAKLLKSKGSIPLARAAIEQASTKSSPAEYIGRIIAGQVAVGRHSPSDPYAGII